LVTTGRRISRQSMQHCVARLRSFLRFCHSNSLLAQPLDAIDTPRVYRDELPPRALPWRIVTGLLRSIDRSTATGWRDYTILHLMSHYGLRPSEVVSLRLDAIDWQTYTLRVVQCKTRSVLVLPMDARTLRIIQRYLCEGRPGRSCWCGELKTACRVKLMQRPCLKPSVRPRRGSLPLAGEPT